jgi:hypothetical protein
MKPLAVLSAILLVIGPNQPAVAHETLLAVFKSAEDESSALKMVGFPLSNTMPWDRSITLQRQGEGGSNPWGASQEIKESLAKNDNLISIFNYTDSPIFKRGVTSAIQCDGTARRLPVPLDPGASWSLTLANWDFEGNMVVKQGHRFVNLRYTSAVRERMQIYSASGPDLRVDISFQKSRGDTEGTLDARNIRTGQRYKAPVTIQEGC